jgi:hypothetical protein
MVDAGYWIADGGYWFMQFTWIAGVCNMLLIEKCVAPTHVIVDNLDLARMVAVACVLYIGLQSQDGTKSREKMSLHPEIKNFPCGNNFLILTIKIYSS